MKISDILRHKGADVATIAPSAGVPDLLAQLADRNIGALVVVDADRVIGMVSERDITRQLRELGAGLLTATVGEIMTTEVISCTSDDSVDMVAATMTERRIRHMPVLQGHALIGVISIGDVVLSRITQLEHDRGQLEQYITG